MRNLKVDQNYKLRIERPHVMSLENKNAVITNQNDASLYRLNKQCCKIRRKYS